MGWINKDAPKNIDEFGTKFKRLHKLTKPRSPQVVEFMTDDPDEWFIDVVRYRRKSGVIVEYLLILKKELKEYLEREQRYGWVLLTED